MYRILGKRTIANGWALLLEKEGGETYLMYGTLSPLSVLGMTPYPRVAWPLGVEDLGEIDLANPLLTLHTLFYSELDSLGQPPGDEGPEDEGLPEELSPTEEKMGDDSQNNPPKSGG